MTSHTLPEVDFAGPAHYPRTITATYLALLAGVAFFVRVWYRYDTVFGAGFVRFAENDPWYHMRVVDHLLHHFPYRFTYDPYRILGGQSAADPPLFDLIVAGVVRVAGGSAPDAHTIDTMAAFVPPALGALVVLPAYGIGERLFSRRAGLLAAALAALLPGNILTRTSLGYVDHHVAEILFTAGALCFLVRAVEPRGRTATLDRILAGVFLGALLLSWSGGSLIVVTFGAGFAAFLAMVLLAQTPSGHASATAITMFGVAALMVFPFTGAFRAAWTGLAALAASTAIVLAVAALPRFARAAPRVPRVILLLIPLVAAAAGSMVVPRLWPGLASDIAGGFGRIRGGASGIEVAEALSPFELPANPAMLILAEFGPALIAGIAGFWIASRQAVRSRSAGAMVVVVMTLVAAIAMASQIRFSYYLAVPVAALAAGACDRLLLRAGRRQEAAFVALVLVVFVPAALLARAHAVGLPGPGAEWHAALTWLREHSPEPFGDPAAYIDSYDGFSEEHRYPYPSAYGVVAWWDTGYWITRIARRIPVANPAQAGVDRVTEVLLAPDDAAAAERLARYRARYVIVDAAMPARLVTGTTVTGSLAQAARGFGGDATTYFEVFYDETTGAPVLLYYPPYYQALATRLYAFNGKAVASPSPRVVVYREEASAGGPRKIIEEMPRFATYDEAQRFAAASTRPARIVGTDPFQSCVPLPAVTVLTLAHDASGRVKIFETSAAPPIVDAPPGVGQR